LRIIYLITSINRGGAENHLYDLAVGQRKNNHYVEIIYFKGDGYWSSNFKKNRIKVLCFNPNFKFLKILNFFLFLYRLVKYLKSEKIDILHSHLPLMDICSRFLFYFLKKDFVFISTKHLDNYCLRSSNQYKNSISYLSVLIEKWIYSKCDKFIAISKNVKNFFVKNCGIDPADIELIHYGIRKIPKKNRNNNKFFFKNYKSKKIIFGTIARLVNQKRIDVTLYALSSLKKDNIEFMYYVMGDGPLLANLRTLAKKLDIHKNVKFLGYSDRVEEFFRNIDVFCLSSDYEGFGLVLLESMFYNVPIICTRVGIANEIIKDKNVGLFFKKGNYVDMAKKLKIILSKKLRKKFLKNLQNFAPKNFSIKKCTDLTEKIYNNQLKQLHK
jgi:glycosyltransferase involved in cell wall biosynthesis